jgi:hypothetical protein
MAGNSYGNKLGGYFFFKKQIKQSNFSLLHEGEVAECLWRWIANLMGFARVGSNPILVDIFFRQRYEFINKEDLINRGYFL